MKQEISNFISNAGTAISAHSPEILAGVGIVGSIAAIIFACRATTKAPKVIEEAKEELQEIRDKEITEEYTKKDQAKELTKSYFKTGVILTKLYAPAIILEAVSLGSIWGSNDISRKRNAALTAGLTAANESFRRYRSNVIDRFGDEIDYELENGIKKQEIVKEVDDPETGKKKKVKETVEVSDPNRSHCYTKYFTRTNPYWDEITGDRMNEDYLENFFSMTLRDLNNSLIAKRHSLKDPNIILNDSLQAYGFPREQYGYGDCWKYDEKNKVGSVDISWEKTHIRNEDGELEECYRIRFRPTHNINGKFIGSAK